jgi:serine/threonine-protein kinase
VEFGSRFRYVYQPLSPGGDTPWLGHEAEVEALRERIAHSDGGTFLVAGFRGVGKTTVVQRALHELSRPDASGRVLVPVHLSLARPVKPEQLLFAIIRRTVDALEDQGLLDCLPSQALKQLLLAYARTSMSLTRHDESSHQSSRNLAFGGATGAAPFLLNSLLPKLELGSSSGRSLAMEASFLGYSDTDVEHDFLRVVGLLKSAPSSTPPPRPWYRRRKQGPDEPQQPAPRPSGLVVVLDELDKLTAVPGGIAAFEEILSALKNILSCDGLHVILVGGPDLHERVLLDVERGEGLYEGVIGWQLYVPCLWDSAARLLDRYQNPTFEPDERTQLAGYLRFAARGLPRRLFQEIGSLVSFQGDSAHLTLTTVDRHRIALYDTVQGVLADFLGDVDPERHSTLDEDRFRMAAHQIMSRILRSEGAVFCADDILRAEQDEQPRPSWISSESVEQLLRHLAWARLLESVGGEERTLVGRELRPPEFYRLPEMMRAQLALLARSSERDRARLFASVGSKERPAWRRIRVAPSRLIDDRTEPTMDEAYRTTPVPQEELSGQYVYVAESPEDVPRLMTRREVEALDRLVPRALNFIGGGRYEVVDLLGVGGMGSVYKARDTQTDRFVAIKVLESATLRQRSEIRRRFFREIEIGLAITARGTARILAGPFQDSEGRVAFVMEFIEGTNLHRLVAETGPLSPAVAARHAREIALSVHQLHRMGIVRLDVKPSNVIISPAGEPVIIDLGIARIAAVSDITEPGVLVGTPTYMAPEQVSGGPLTVASDVCSIGLVLWFMISGQPPRGDYAEPAALFHRIVNEELDPSGLPCSAYLREVIREATRINPAERFISAQGMALALDRAPEIRQRPPTR